MEKNNKIIRMKGKGWSLKAIAIEVPSCDVDITVNISKKMTTDDADIFARELKLIIEEWHLDSRVLSAQHIITHIAHPTYPVRTKLMSMSICIELSVMTRRIIEKDSTSFQLIMNGEIQRLIDELGLEKIVESASE